MARTTMEGTTMKRIGMSATVILLLLVFRIPGYCGTAGPDAAGYTATDQTTYGFENIASTGARILAGADDATQEVNLGFSFRFYGQDYTAVCISTNGLLAFGACNADFANVDLTSSAPSGDARIAAPFWTDLNFSIPGSDAVYYQAFGSAPQRRFVVQWNAGFPLNGPSGVTFQAILYEGANNIAYQYLSVGAGNNGQIATIGVRDAGGQLNNRFLQWSYGAAVLKDGMALLFTPGGGPVTSYLVTASVSPAGAGTVNGAGSYPAGSDATLTANANPGYVFSTWSGTVGTSKANPLTFKVDGPKQAVANFLRLQPALYAAVTGKTGDQAARVWTVQLRNSGAGAASDAELTRIVITPATACTTAPSVVTSLPVAYGTLAPRTGAAANPVTINFSGCAPTTRFSVRFEFRANSGTYTGSSTLNNQYR